MNDTQKKFNDHESNNKNNKREIFEPDPQRTCFVGGIPVSFTEQDLKEVLSQKLPELTYQDVFLIKSKKKKKLNKGFGFVTVADQAQQKKLIEARIFLENDKKLDIRKAKKMEEQRKNERLQLSKRVFLRGLKENINNDMFKDFLLERQYKFQRCYIVMDDKRHVSKGIGIIDFSTEEEANSFVKQKSIMIEDSFVEISHFSLDIKLNRTENNKNSDSSQILTQKKFKEDFEPHFKSKIENSVGNDSEKEWNQINSRSQNMEQDINDLQSYHENFESIQGPGLERHFTENILSGNRPVFSVEEANDQSRYQNKWAYLVPTMLKKINETPLNYRLTRIKKLW